MPPKKATERSGKKATRSTKATTSDDGLRAALRQFIRTRGEDYLRDPNVSSIGIGYKVTDGQRTPQLSIQFTVNEKASTPEALAELDTTPLPKTITVDGVGVPTDVLERSYAPAFRLVPEPVTMNRKVRVDPVVPGVSVANVHVSAGTIGAIVYDRANGTPYVLSNWHVLHGRDGAIGDDIVQPGPHDDNRVQLNRLGRLVRSHLGIARDCAVASIEDRDFDPTTTELGVVPEQLGEPELDDRVVKSGRTTGVTHGIVRRVDTIAQINYGGAVGVQNIGCFEIGPDPDRRPPMRSAAAVTPGRSGCSPRTGLPRRSLRDCTSPERRTAARTSTRWPACLPPCSRSSRSRCSRRRRARSWRPAATTATSWANASTSPP
jgi:endonuclease G